MNQAYPPRQDLGSMFKHAPITFLGQDLTGSNRL